MEFYLHSIRFLFIPIALAYQIHRDSIRNIIYIGNALFDCIAITETPVTEKRSSNRPNLFRPQSAAVISWPTRVFCIGPHNQSFHLIKVVLWVRSNVQFLSPVILLTYLSQTQQFDCIFWYIHNIKYNSFAWMQTLFHRNAWILLIIYEIKNATKINITKKIPHIWR